MKNILLIIIIAFLTQSCTERMDLDKELGKDFPQYVVVEAFVNTDTTEHVVKLTRSKKLDDTNAVDKVTGAQVSISGNGREILLTEKEDGFYYTPSDFYVVIGQRYYLSVDGVDIDGDGNFDLITATDSVPSVPELDSVKLKYYDPWEAWAIQPYAQEPGDEENFYMFKASVNHKTVTDTLYEFVVTDDFLFNGSYISGLDTYYLNKEDQDEKIEVGDTVTLEISGVSEKAYDFILQAQIEAGYSSPLFSGPPSNVEHNIEGYYVFGAFVTYASNRKSCIWQE